MQAKRLTVGKIIAALRTNQMAAGARIEERTHAPNGLLAAPYEGYELA